MKVAFGLLVLLYCTQMVTGQDFLVFCNTLAAGSTVCDSYLAAFGALGESPLIVDNRELTVADLNGINILFDLTIGDCGAAWAGTTIPAIQFLFENGKAVFFQLSDVNDCNSLKLELLNSYLINDPVVYPGDPSTAIQMASSLPDETICVLTNPNVITGRDIVTGGLNDFAGSINMDSSLAINTVNSRAVAGIWSSFEVSTCSRVIIWSDLTTDWENMESTVLQNFLSFLRDGCFCDIGTACNGVECGIGACCNLCSSTCDGDTEHCLGNSCAKSITSPDRFERWSIYNPACITWDTTLFAGQTGDIVVEYGNSFAESKTIITAMDLDAGEYEWLIAGVYPSTGRIVFTTNGGITRTSEPFEIGYPGVFPPTPCA